MVDEQQRRGFQYTANSKHKQRMADTWYPTGQAGSTGTNSQGAVLSTTRPADLPEADWNALKGRLSKTTPQAEAEAARVADYLQYQKRFEYWQTTEGSKSTKERASLAEALLQEIPARLAKGRIHGWRGPADEHRPDHRKRTQRRHSTAAHHRNAAKS